MKFLVKSFEYTQEIFGSIIVNFSSCFRILFIPLLSMYKFIANILHYLRFVKY